MSEKTSFLRGEGGAIFTWKELSAIFSQKSLLNQSFLFTKLKWHDLSREEQARYYEKARTERQKHMEMYPNWNARDNYRFGLKKKKRKRDKADDPGDYLETLINCLP